MITESKISKLEKILDIAKKQGASEVEVIQKSWCDNPVNFENNKLKSLESNESSGISVRLIKNKKIGLASSTDPEAFESIFSTNFYAQLIRDEDFLGIYEGNSSLDDFPGEKEISNIILEKLNYSREII